MKDSKLSGPMRALYKIILDLGAQVSQHDDCITTYYIRGGSLYQNHFIIHYNEGRIEPCDDEQIIPMG